ncbi:MAG: HAMP domain-containing sensor histidine kinase, partial [Bacteroidota bacterium]
GVIVVIRNITEFKRIEMIKSQFVSMVAHELKAPVAAVQGFLNLLLDEKMELSEEKKKDFLSRSENRLKSLLTLVNDLLDISRMEMKTKQRELKDIDIKECIDSTIDLLQFESAKRNISVTTSYAKDLPMLHADQNEITRMFTNIISNAVKYNIDNGTININVSLIKNYVSIKVTDTGIGLKPEEITKLFSEFFRAKNENTRGISGTGLGLTIVKRIIDSYHGKIEVESEYGKGTTFSIFLPININ